MTYNNLPYFISFISKSKFPYVIFILLILPNLGYSTVVGDANASEMFIGWALVDVPLSNPNPVIFRSCTLSGDVQDPVFTTVQIKESINGVTPASMVGSKGG